MGKRIFYYFMECIVEYLEMFSKTTNRSLKIFCHEVPQL